MKPQIIAENASYTFSDYAKPNFYTKDILAYFGYAFQVQSCALPQADIETGTFGELKTRLEEGLPYLSLTSEVARREFLIAPVLWEVVRYTHAEIRVEYPLEVNDQLKGTIDYYLQARNNLLVVEAKHADPERGFTQLAVELVAFDHWLENDTEHLYGAVSMGNVWQFGILDRQARQVAQDFNLYRVPADVEQLLRILIAILTGE